MMSLVLGKTLWVLGSVHSGMSTRVSRGMLTTDILLRSADRCAIMITSARGASPTVDLAPPSLRSAGSLRLSDPRIMMFIAVLPAALAFVLATWVSPLLRSPLRIL